MRRTMRAAIALVLAAALILPVIATGPPTLSLSSGEVKPGEAVTLTLSIENNPGLAGCMPYFYYDTSVFTVDPATDVASAGSFRQAGMVMANSIAMARQNGVFEGDPVKDGTVAIWLDLSGKQITGDGPIMQITLHAADAAPGGSYEVGLGYSERDTYNGKLEDVPMDLSGGTVSVKSDAPVQTAPPPTQNSQEVQDYIDGKTETPPVAPAVTAPPVTAPAPVKQEETPQPAVAEPEKPAVPVFNDIAGNWAEYYIKLIAARGIMNGMGGGRYAPNDPMRRCEYATILWRAQGEPEPAGEASFTDLDPTQSWYHKAVAWVEEKGIMNGVGNGRFDPNGNVTREQLVTILHRLAGSPSGMEVMLGSMYDQNYPDSGMVQSWARPSLHWAIYNGIYCGVNSVEAGTELLPGEPADRAQIAVMIERYMESEEEKE